MKKTFALVLRRPKVFILLIFLIVLGYVALDFALLVGSSKSQWIVSSVQGRIVEQGNPACTEQKNIVFIKQMKCATSTLLGTFYRFGYKRNLTFASPISKRLYLNWPYKLTPRDVRPSRSGYNILTDHSIYTEDVMKSLMPNDTVYISIIRHPLAHAKSVFQYFKLNLVAHVPKDGHNPFVTYFRDIEKYEAMYVRPNAEGRSCIPNGFSLTKNCMSHCLGMPLGFPPGTQNISNDTKAIDEYFYHIKRKFKLIMIVEYFYESLILLRRLLCWQFNDLLFMKANIAMYSFATDDIPTDVLEIHKKWTAIDYRLYDFFNKTFWERVSDHGDAGFFDEVAAFKLVEEKVQLYCNSLYKFGERPAYRYPKGLEELVIESSKWTESFKVTPEDCWMIGPNPYKLLRVLQDENDVKEAALLRQRSLIPDNREFRALC